MSYYSIIMHVCAWLLCQLGMVGENEAHRAHKPENEPLIYALRARESSHQWWKARQPEKLQAKSRFTWSPVMGTDLGLLANSLRTAKRSHSHTWVAKKKKKKKKSSFWIQIQHMCWWSFRQIWENIRPAEAGIWVFPRTLISPNAPSKSIWGADGIVRFLIIWSLSGEKRQVTNPV